MSKKPVKAVAKKSAASRVFNILEDGADLVSSVKESLARSEANVMIAGDPNKSKIIIPIPAFPFCAALRARGLVSGTLFDILGADGLGKTSLGFTMMGWNMASNGPCMYIETEGKPLDRSRVERCLHPDRKIAGKMFDAINQESAREIREAINKAEEWLIDIRAPGSRIPPSTPAMIIIDTFSKLMSPTEAAGFAGYDSSRDKAKKKAEAKKDAFKKAKRGETATPDKDDKYKADQSKELGVGSNFEHSKYAHEWARRLPYYLGKYNAIIVVIRHQNDKIDMGGGGGIMLSAEQKDAFNRASNTGRAFLQNAAYQLILSRQDFVKQTIGQATVKSYSNVKVTTSKNNFGPLLDTRYRLTLLPKHDTETQQEMVVDFDAFLGDLLANFKLMNVRAKNATTVVCSDFNDSGRAEEFDIREFAQRFYQKPGLVDKLGKQLGFAHYDDRSAMPKVTITSVPEIAESTEASSESEETPPEVEPEAANA